jgi:hypothetical protein
MSTRPFGRAVFDLHFYRRTFAVNVMWLLLPEGWEMKSSIVFGKGGILAIPQALFEHRALLFTKDGVPISEVRETYQRALLDFPLPHPSGRQRCIARMTVLGQKLSSGSSAGRSVGPSTSDIRRLQRHVGSVPIADSCCAT